MAWPFPLQPLSTQPFPYPLSSLPVPPQPFPSQPSQARPSKRQCVSERGPSFGSKVSRDHDSLGDSGDECGPAPFYVKDDMMTLMKQYKVGHNGQKALEECEKDGPGWRRGFYKSWHKSFAIIQLVESVAKYKNMGWEAAVTELVKIIPELDAQFGTASRNKYHSWIQMNAGRFLSLFDWHVSAELQREGYKTVFRPGAGGKGGEKKKSKSSLAAQASQLSHPPQLTQSQTAPPTQPPAQTAPPTAPSAPSATPSTQPQKPKAVSGYVLFCGSQRQSGELKQRVENEAREKAKAQELNVKQVEAFVKEATTSQQVTRALATAWKELTDGDKASWNKRAAELTAGRRAE